MVHALKAEVMPQRTCMHGLREETAGASTLQGFDTL